MYMYVAYQQYNRIYVILYRVSLTFFFYSCKKTEENFKTINQGYYNQFEQIDP